MNLSSQRRAEVAELIAASVSSAPGVACLTPGAGAVEAATYYPGGKTTGVVVGDGHISVHVVASRPSLLQVAEGVRQLVHDLCRSEGLTQVRVEVVIEDLDLVPAILAEHQPPTGVGVQ